MEVVGIIAEISDTVQVSERFKKREFVLDMSYQYQDTYYQNFGKFMVINGHCDLLDDFSVTDKVRVHFKLKGTRSIKDSIATYWNNQVCFRIHAEQQQYTVNNLPPSPVTNDQQIQSFYAQQPPVHPNEIIDDLPF